MPHATDNLRKKSKPPARLPSAFKLPMYMVFFCHWLHFSQRYFYGRPNQANAQPIRCDDGSSTGWRLYCGAQIHQTSTAHAHHQ